MQSVFEQVYEAVRAWAQRHGVSFHAQRLKPEKAGAFDGVSATMNRDYDKEEVSYYLAHALGSIVFWSRDRPGVQALFDELRDAKKDRANDPARLERAIERYRAFEIESSELAVWLLAELGHGPVVPSYTNFLRADLEALTEFHRRGQAPVWRTFFARWNDDVARGRQPVVPFQPKPIPPFTPAAIENQEILQRQDAAV